MRNCLNMLVIIITGVAVGSCATALGPVVGLVVGGGSYIHNHNKRAEIIEYQEGLERRVQELERR